MIKDNVIIKLSKEHYFLDNFYPCSVEYDGITYQNSEATFQAQKAPKDERKTFANLNGRDAKYRGGKHGSYAMIPGSEELALWNEKSLKVMEEVVRAKFSQNEDLKEKLLATGDLRIIEGNNHDDNKFGISLLREDPYGRSRKLKVDKDGLFILAYPETENNNHLGKILMKIREELRNSL